MREHGDFLIWGAIFAGGYLLGKFFAMADRIKDIHEWLKEEEPTATEPPE